MRKVNLVPGKKRGGPAWTPQEDRKLRDKYPSAFPEELRQLFPGRSPTAVTQHAIKLGVQHGPRRVYFPRELNSLIDGGYVTGLTDGEGSFVVSTKRREDGLYNFNPKFSMRLRIDDQDILLWLMKYFGCGNYREDLKVKSPSAVFCIASLYDIASSVIPHFDKFPLRAKKKRDFVIWKDLVNLSIENFRQPMSEELSREMNSLYSQLQSARKLK